MAVPISFMIDVAVMLIKPALMFLGVAFILTLLIIKIGHRLPGRAQGWLQNKLMRRATTLGGPVQGLVQDSDGVLKLYNAEYDPDNSGYWINLGGNTGWKFFSAEGEGGGPKWFYGSNVVLAYDGLGAASDLVSARIGSEAKVKRRAESRGRKVYSQSRERLRDLVEDLDAPDVSLPDGLRRSDDGDLLSDGGMPDYVTEYTAYIPERAIVDLRDTLYNAPFHVRPAQFHRVEENAKAGQGTTWSENLIRIGLLLTGFMLAVIAFFVFGGSGGGGGGAISIPAMVGVM